MLPVGEKITLKKAVELLSKGETVFFGVIYYAELKKSSGGYYSRPRYKYSILFHQLCADDLGFDKFSDRSKILDQVSNHLKDLRQAFRDRTVVNRVINYSFIYCVFDNVNTIDWLSKVEQLNAPSKVTEYEKFKTI